MTALYNGDGPSRLHPPTIQEAAAATEVERLAALERRLLRVIPWMVFGGVILLTLGAGTLSWSHLTHIAATNGHIAPRWLLCVFPSIVDGFMILGVWGRGLARHHGRDYLAHLVRRRSGRWDGDTDDLPQHPGRRRPHRRAGLAAAGHRSNAVPARHRAGLERAASTHAPAPCPHPGRVRQRPTASGSFAHEA